MKDILIMESNDYQLQYMGRIVTRLGYRCALESDFHLGLNHLKENPCDAIISSDRMKGITLPELTNNISNIRPNVPVMAVTSDSSPGLSQEFSKYGIREFIKKPISVREFYNSLERCLGVSGRKHIRVPLRFPVSITENGDIYRGQCINFGEGGMYVHSDRQFPRGASLDLSFTPPGMKRDFDLNASVQHSIEGDRRELPAGMGIMFLNLLGSFKTVFSIYLENHLALKAPPSLQAV